VTSPNLRIVLLLVSALGPRWFPGYVPSQGQPPGKALEDSRHEPNQDADKPAPTCAKVLQMTSTEWVANVTALDPSVEAQLRAIGIYGDCYDARTKRLALAMAKAGRGPLMGARGDFNDFEAALKDFTTQALALTAADQLKFAYVSLYEKQFRYNFYQSYEAKTAGASKAAPRINSAPAAADSGSPSNDASGRNAASDADEMTKAKNRFGELLDALPEDKLHALHASFGNIVGLHPMNSTTQLALYRYAIFVLEPLPPANSAGSKPPTTPGIPSPF
jgi:hypothetical protein